MGLLNPYLEGYGVHPFPQSTSSKLNAIVRLEFELVYYAVAVQPVSHFATETRRLSTNSLNKKINNWQMLPRAKNHLIRLNHSVKEYLTWLRSSQLIFLPRQWEHVYTEINMFITGLMKVSFNAITPCESPELNRYRIARNLDEWLCWNFRYCRLSETCALAKQSLLVSQATGFKIC